MNHQPTKPNPNDTIVACATPEGYSSIGVIRVSGDRAEAVVRRIFKPGYAETKFESHRAYFGDIIDQASGKVIDKVITTFHKKPYSYTGEDVVEISCHGNPLIIDRIINELIAQGIRLADRGEFTKRALLNGKIDLLQAEAVLDTVYSPCEEVRKLAIAQYEGKLSDTVRHIRRKLEDILVVTEAQIDFGDEEDVQGRTQTTRSMDDLRSLKAEIETILQHAEIGIKMKKGYRVLIMGRANVGKSTLFNRLVGYERALIHPDPGTTRDFLEEHIEISGLLIRLFDTAGILNKPYGPDQLAQERSGQLIEQSDLIVLLFDCSEPMNEQDVYLYNLTKEKTTIAVVNKVDLNVQLNESVLLSDSIKISAKTGKNMDVLLARIRALLLPVVYPSDDCLITKQRHMQVFRDVLACVQRSLDTASAEMIAFEVKSALHALGTLTGDSLDINVLDRIFEEFCIGK
jgi:tRNA modification GTPase